MNKTFVYIDGFNLYYRALKRTRYKWLNLRQLCERILPPSEYDLKFIRYFTAKVKNPPNDPGQQSRQQIYFRALRTLPDLEIHYGSFLQNKAWLPDASNPINPDGSWNTIEVIKSEEKGSDVNLTTYLLLDGFRNLYDTAVLVTNDSDYEEPIRVVKNDIGKRVEVFCPAPHVNLRLSRVADKCDVTWRSTIRNCQFPHSLTDAKGTFHKPPKWN